MGKQVKHKCSDMPKHEESVIDLWHEYSTFLNTYSL